MEEIIYRYQVLPLTIPSGTPINQLLTADITLDKAFNTVTGINVVVVDDGGTNGALLIGGRTNRKIWVDQVPQGTWDSATGVSPDEKYLSTKIPFGSNDSFYMDVTVKAATTRDALIYMTLRLESKTIPLPNM